MRQQVNLYQSLFRAEPFAFPARTLLQGLVIVTAGLLAVWIFDAWRLRKLGSEFATLQTTQAAQTALLQNIGAAGVHLAPAVLEPQWRQTRDQLAQHRRALATLDAGSAGTLTGFSAALASLGRHHIEGIWLEHIRFGDDARLQTLDGTALDADLVPRYLHDLTAEPALHGTQIDDFRIEAPPVGGDAARGVRFHARRTAEPVAEDKG